ncbi:hypothetical protein BDQ12DRAFT_366888 [Crucibulum laeve]|uniref:Myb-like domain-containing protein n=1 Tax=Crucibulum laeve TaxID=68775 RepID=A0A5C3LQ63_9AGAR|nr:hypothetical protein BDQ12DRAFT_366888 [Crucibulum laeve]
MGASHSPPGHSGQRKIKVSGNISSYCWLSDQYIHSELFLLLLARHGDDFKRISASMPNKTTSQVNSYYKANEEELNLKEIATSAPKRSLSPAPNTEKPPPSSSASQVPPPPTTAISNSTLPDSAPPMGALLPDSPQRKIAPVPPSSAPVASSSHSTMSDKSSRGPATKNVPPPTAPAALRAPSKFPARQRTPPIAPASFLSRNGSNAPNSEPYVYKPPSHFISSTHYRTGTSPPTRPTYQPSSTTSRPYVYPTHYVPQPRIPPGASHSHAHSPYTYGHPTTMPTANNTQGHYPAYTPNSASRNALPPRNANGRHEPYTYNPGLPHPYYYP